MGDRCPMCHRPFGNRPARVCGDCGGQILKGHKYWFDGSVIKHRDCKDPHSYPQKAAEEK